VFAAVPAAGFLPGTNGGSSPHLKLKRNFSSAMPTLLNLAGAKRAGLILANAAKVVEAVAIAAYSAGAHRGLHRVA